MSTTTPSDLRRLATSLLGLTLALSPSIARADDAQAPTSEPAPAPAPAPVPAQDDALSSLRGRFREGMEKYKAGAFAEAIVIWESVYRDLGSDKGYRLAFDLARAYDELGDLNKAAEHYETYLDRVGARRTDGETLEPNVAKQESDARDRREKIAAIKGRIRVKAVPTRTVVVQIDNTGRRIAGFTVYVEPGVHTVTFGAGRDTDVRRVTLNRGELVDVDPRADTPVAEAPQTRWETRVDRPFSSAALWIGAGVALASIVVPVITYANALSIKSDYDDPTTASSEKNRLAADYESARSNAYASIVVPALFTAAAGTLALYYVLGTKETRIPVTPQASITQAGASVGLAARF